MNGDVMLPEAIRVEVKFTRSRAVVVSARELEALRTTDLRSTGLLAVLFWCGDRRLDGRWLVVDARESLDSTSRRSQRWLKDDLARVEAYQPWLAAVLTHVNQFWKPFLQAFFNEAIAGIDTLREELARCHADGTTSERLPRESVLDAEHRGAMRALVEHHGESVAGHVFQDLFAYLLAYAGYQKVTINPVGVPDVVVSEFGRGEVSSQFVHLGAFDIADVLRLARYCREAGDSVLTDRIMACIERSGVPRRPR
ncbi:hypothetical protein [Sorangium sp. So ce341]|uniref:hypothetical protein n=1 Tax=Sorangium sp. So ce341 TaxID=3133302 RepID=UPI003F5DBFF1